MPMSLFKSTWRFLFLSLALLFTGLCLSCGSGGESGATNPSNITPIALEGCGDAELDPGEGCDDGNWENSDGCNARCGLEVGESFCANGVKENDECCDDGNLTNGDGCTSVCTLEAFNRPPVAPVLGTDPADGVTWAPTRLYLSWLSATDSDIDDTVVYDVFFAEGNGIPSNAFPYRSSVSETEFVIQASTDNRAKYFPDRVLPIHLQPLRTYTWMICARDNQGATSCSPTRAFNTDDSVKGWWRFDENPSGPNCPGGNGGETVCDYSGNNNHGVPHGNPAWLAPAPDILGQSLEFDGTDDYVSVQSAGALNPDSLSVVALLKTNGEVGPQQVLDKRSLGAGYNLRAQGSVYPLQIDWVITESDDTNHELLMGMLVNATRYQVVGTFDSTAGDVKSYSNGTLVGSQNLGILNRATKSTANLLFGEDSYNAAPSMFNYKGTLDEILIINRVLSTQEIINGYGSVN